MVSSGTVSGKYCYWMKSCRRRGKEKRNSVNCAEVPEGCRKEVDGEDARSSRAGSLKVSFSL